MLFKIYFHLISHTNPSHVLLTFHEYGAESTAQHQYAFRMCHNTFVYSIIHISNAC